LDILPILLDEELSIASSADNETRVHLENKGIDEQAESLARKCTRFFGPNNLPLLHVGFLGDVRVDADFHIQLTNKDCFQQSVRPKTWLAVEQYAKDLKERQVKIAFFSATPQGGGVALMRHALIRLAHEIGVDIKWYVPKPKPGIFRITKTNHNILQGVSVAHERLDLESQQRLVDWVDDNANRYWLRTGGPLCRPADGGADVIIVDDPQMTGLIPIAKRMDPQRPIIYRSHIQMRNDLIESPGSPQAEVWKFLWEQIQDADIFISHPVDSFVPRNVPQARVGYMPACTDWLDGLNKNMRDWDTAFYGRIFNHSCNNLEMITIDYPNEPYIVQIARFDPAKGIFDVLTSYDRFRSLLARSHPEMKAPKLLVCGHGSIDDPDGSMIYDEVLQRIQNTMPHLSNNICVMRVGPSDQVLNTLLSKAHIVLQLSVREGFEVKVSEAIHKGKPVIATRAGGIPLQLEDTKNGYLVEVGDTDTVANHLLNLWTDHDLYQRISAYSLSHISDEVGTVGHALNWFYLASKLSRGQDVQPNQEWIQDLARRELGQTYTKVDGKLKRSVDDPH
jgi:glycosyltransferase involved in cell wall biosynthesis